MRRHGLLPVRSVTIPLAPVLVAVLVVVLVVVWLVVRCGFVLAGVTDIDQGREGLGR